MEKAIIGKKVGMSQIFDADGKVIPVTVIEAGPCVVVQKKTAEKDGYEAVQLGYEDVPERKLTKPEKGHLDKAGVSPKKHLKEFKLKKAAEMNVGDVVKADAFAEGDHVDHRHQQGSRLRRRHQAPRGPLPEGHPRYRPRRPAPGLPGLRHRPQPYFQGTEDARPHGRGAGHCYEPGCRQG